MPDYTVSSDIDSFLKATDDADARARLGVDAAGTGMATGTYDPTSVVGDAFDMDNMVEGTNLILTAAERTKLGDQVLTDVIDKMAWNPTDLTFDVDTGTGVVIQVGQELLVKVRNTTGSTIVNGKVVRINGASGTRPTVTAAQADSLANINGVIGVVTADITNNAVGFATVHGLVRDLDTSAFTEGDELFLSDSVAGDVTSVEPPLSIPIGTVTFANPATGTIFVNAENQTHLLEFASDPSLVGNFSAANWKTELAISATDLTATGTADATTYLRGDNTWATVAGGGGGGDVVGPASAVENNFASFDTTTGKLIKDSGSAAATFATAAQGTDARTPTAHAASHTDGTDDIQDATNAVKGLATAAQITALESATAAQHAAATSAGTGTHVSIDTGTQVITVDPITASDIDSTGGADGTILTSDGVGGAAWEAAPVSGALTTADSTGVLTGGVLSLGATSTRYSISDGTGIIVDEAGVTTNVSWFALLNKEPVNLNAQQITFVSIDSLGAIIEQASPWTPQQRREQICIGVAVHVDFANVIAVNNEQVISYNPHSSTYDIGEALGFLNLEGNVFSANAASSMAIKKSAGQIFKMGANYNINTQAPHNKDLPALAPVTFGYRYSAGTTDTNQTVIDPNNLDDGANGLTLISGNANANKWSIQRIYSFISNNVFIQRGREEFNSLADAVAGIGSENYEVESSIEANGLFRGYLIVKKGETDLESANTTFIEASKFGAAGAGSGSSPHTPEGTAIKSTTETEGLKFLREDGDDTCSWQRITETIGMACSDEDTAPLTAGEAVVFDMPYNFEITKVYATVKAVGGTTPISVNLEDEATQILTADLGIPAGVNFVEASGAVFNGAATSYLIAKNNRFSANIVSPDTSNTGAGLKIFIEGTRY